jgi:hypothetical protein
MIMLLAVTRRFDESSEPEEDPGWRGTGGQGGGPAAKEEHNKL